jgi:hypothetical protein
MKPYLIVNQRALAVVITGLLAMRSSDATGQKVEGASVYGFFLGKQGGL